MWSPGAVRVAVRDRVLSDPIPLYAIPGGGAGGGTGVRGARQMKSKFTEKIKKDPSVNNLSKFVDKHVIVCYSMVINEEEETVMNEIEIVKALMKAKGMSGKTLSEKMGYNTPSGVTNRLQSKTMTVEKLIEMLDAMDCELVIKNKVGEKEVFTVVNENRNDVKVYKKKDGADNE